MSKRAYQEDHQFDEDAMPCICSVCNGWFDLDDGSANPRKDNEIICEGCADDIQKEVDIEEEIEELETEISDANDTIKHCTERLEQLKLKQVKS
jgi:hypothetical protein